MISKAAMIFVQLLSLIAPSVWIFIAGALGFTVGAYGPTIIGKFKAKRKKPIHDSHVPRKPRRQTR